MNCKGSKFALNSPIQYITHQNYSCDASLGRKVLSHRLHSAKNLYRMDLYAHYGCVNAVEFSNEGEWLVSGGDDKRVLVWNVDKCLSGHSKPRAMKGEHNSNIFCLSFDSKHQKIFSAGNDEQVILHDVATGETTDVFLHDEAVYGLSVDPQNDNVFASACDDGRIQIWDIRTSMADPFTLANSNSAFHAVMYNPAEPRLIVAANAKDGVGLWDVRRPPVALMKYGGSLLSQSAMSVCFNASGTHILALRRRLPPVLFDINSVYSAAEFDHREYYNSCTMKTCCFAGDNDEYVISGSDDFKLYVWRIPDNINQVKGQWINDAHLVLRGHRSIVNQVRYNHHYGIIASSGVEKIIKLWSSFPLKMRPESSYVTDKDGLRRVYSHEEYITLVLESGQFLTHDYSHHSIQEDPRMMAFFDSLVQRDIEGWTSDSSETSGNANGLTCFEVQSAESSSSSSLSSASSSDDEEAELVSIYQQRLKRTWSSIVRDLPFANFDRSSSAATATTSSAGNTSESGEQQGGSLTTEKISQLIAKKRQDQVLRNVRIRQKMKQHLKSMKRCVKSRVKNMTKTRSSSDNDVASVGGAVSKIRSVLQTQSRDRQQIQMLQKMRARLLRDHVSGESSDSDIGSGGAHSNSVNETSRAGEKIVTDPIKNLSPINLVMVKNETAAINEENCPQESDIEAERSVTNTNVLNGERVTFLNESNRVTPSGEVDRVIPEGALNGDGRSPEGALNSEKGTQSKAIIFQAKTAKHHSRNYRKRSAEDMQDDC